MTLRYAHSLSLLAWGLYDVLFARLGPVLWLAGFLLVFAAGPAGAQHTGYRVVSPSVLEKNSLNGAQIVLRAGKVGNTQDEFRSQSYSDSQYYTLSGIPDGVSLSISNFSLQSNNQELVLTLSYSGNFTSDWKLSIQIGQPLFNEYLYPAGPTYGPIPVRVGHDSDGNGLIEIETLAQLHAIRWDLNGDGVVDTTASTTDSTAYVTAFPRTPGCLTTGCIGYELMADLNFDENDDNQITAADTTYWNGGNGWDPIGPPFGSTYGETQSRINNLSFNATFEGNGYLIKNLYINRNRNWSGLFSALRDTAVVRSLGLPNARVQDGEGSVGVLAGQNSGRVAAVWATGSVQGNTNVGGLLGNNLSGSEIVASYTMASVECRGTGGHAGGLVVNAGTVRASYSTGAVTGACPAANKHGLTNGGTVIASYWDSQSSGILDDSDTTAPEGRTTQQLQSPMGYTGIYSVWDDQDVDDDGNAGAATDDAWDFGTASQYPVLRYQGMDPVAQRGDYDVNDNGLIEVYTLGQLNAIRYDLDGDGAPSSGNATAYEAAFRNHHADMGCPTTPGDSDNNDCTGYELMADLDFDENDDGQITAVDATYWNGGNGWDPIGPPFANSYGVDLSRITNGAFNATFEGNGHVIANLFINHNRNWSGLFAALRDTAVVRSLGLPNAQVLDGGGSVAPLAGQNSGRVAAVWATGSVRGNTNVGGLVGNNLSGSVIVASYTMAAVECRSSTGLAAGLAASNAGTVRASYSTGSVTGACSAANKHGLTSGGTVVASYWDSERSGIADDIDTTSPEGKPSVQLQSPTSYSSTAGNTSAIYSAWNVDVDGVMGTDDPWRFGASDQYPVLKYAGLDTAAQYTAHPPVGVTLAPSLDTLVVRWFPVRNATGYKVQWKSGNQAYPTSDQTSSTHGQATVSSGSDTTYAIAMLTNGTLYTVRVLATWPGMIESAPSSEVLGSPGIRYDGDGDGLIEIGTLAQLNAMRGDLNGDGVVDTSASTTDSTAYVTAFSNAVASMGCPSLNCIGYELAVNLTFPASGDFSTWTPISGFNTTFDGGGHTLTGLSVTGSGDTGLFGTFGSTALVRNLGLVTPSIVSTATVARSHGALVGYMGSGGTIHSVYVSGGSISTNVAGSKAGGLVGYLVSGTIRASYATATVGVSSNPNNVAVGGLVGELGGSGSGGGITACYAAGAVSGGSGTGLEVGGLVGKVENTSSSIANSYCDTTATGQPNCIGATGTGVSVTSTGYTTAQLQDPTGYTGIYATWDDHDLDGDTNADEPWDFGADDQYPVLKFGRDAEAIAAQFAAQPLGAPRGVTLTAFEDSLVVRWSAVNYATGYKVQWKSDGQSYNMTDRQDTVSVGRDTTHAIANLTNGTPYTVRVTATQTGEADSAPSAEVMGTPGTPYDRDGNGLIEIGTLAQLNAMRWDLNGDGAVADNDTMTYNAAFPSAASGMGCPGGTCTGYELTADLNLDTDGSETANSGDTYWNGGSGWAPIDTLATTVNGNDHTISHLFINRASTDNLGLFRVIGASGSVTNLGLSNVDITGEDNTGALAGEIVGGTVTGVFATGRVTGVDRVGGLVGSVGLGSSTGSILTSYSTASVTGTGTSIYIGGLVGNLSSGAITAAYATGTVTDTTTSTSDIGGLVGAGGGAITACYATGQVSGIGGGLVGTDFSGTYTNNYYDRETTGQSNTVGATPKTTAQLQEPIGYTGIYATWDDSDLDGDNNPDEPWDLGADDQYPVLKFGRDAEAIAAQFAAQPPGVPQGVAVTALVESLDVRWSAVNYATGYKVQWKSGMQTYDVASRQSLVTGTRDTIPSLTGGTPYTVRIIATKTGAPDGRPSAEQTGTPKSAPPGVPGNVMVTPYVLALRVAWDAATNADGYKVQWKAAGDAYDAATREYAVGGTDTTIVGLTAGTSYTVRVLATREYADDEPASSELTGTPLAIPSLSITSPDVAEGAAGATDTLRFAVTLSHASQHAVTVAYAMGTGTATAGTDYTALADGTLTLAPNVLSDTLAVAVIGDGMDEPDETVVITLSSPTNATFGDAGALAGTGTITDDDAAVATLILSSEAISENGGVATVTATLSSPESAAVTITVSAAPVGHAVIGDFTLLTPATLIIAAGETTSTGLVTIRANDNNARAPTKSVTVSGTADAANTVADPDAVTLEITDDESAQVTLALSSTSILENGGVATVTATLSSAENEATTITVSATPVDPAVTTDFSVSTTKTLTIVADSLTSTGLVTITAQDDTLDGLDKTVTVSGTVTGGNNATAPRAVTLTITDDDDPPTLSIESPRLDEGNTGSAPLSFRVTLSAASEKQITVAYAMGTGTATAGEDYTALADGTLTFAPGTTSQTLAVSIIGDETDEPHETVLITLRDPTNATFTGDATILTGTGTITDDDPAVATLVLSSATISENGGITTVTATLSTPEGAAVTITVSATPEGHAVRGDFSLLTPATLTIAADSLTSTGLVTITAVNNLTDAPDKSVTVSGTADDTPDVVAPPAPVTLTITDDDDPMSIPDDSLRAVIEDSLNKASGAAITRAEMATLTRLIAPNKTIRDLTGLEFATGLDTLDLSDNNIEDIQPLVDNAGLGVGVAIDLRGNPLNDQSRDVHVPALEARGVAVQVQPTTNLDVDADGTADLTDAIMVILYLFGLENEGITNYILFSPQATRTNPEAVTAYIETLINTRRIDIDADGTVDLTDIIMVILYLFGLENEGITDYILFSQQATRTDPQDVTDYIASLLP